MSVLPILRQFRTARPISGVDTANSINYATAGTYAPQGALSALTLGSATGFTGVNLSNTYNNRLQPNEVKAWSTAGTAFNLSYCFNAWNTSTNACSTTAGSNNGNVNGITNNKDGTRTQFFSYDQVNRIQTGATIPSCGANCWGLTFGYDQWANLTTATATGSATSLNLTVNGNNQITTAGFTYDASGNLTADVTSAYAWNAESEIKTAAGVNYTYDGDGNRVQKSNGKIYWYGAGTEILDESDASGNITDEYVFFGGKRVAHRTVSSGSITYYAGDFLGSTRVMTTSTGAVCYDADFYPYGGEKLFTSTCAQNYKFEGKERDTETGNDDFGARYYSSVYGRWLSPDWSSVPAPVPYADLTNPQTLNLYAMVRDNPETFADLDGHCDWCSDALDFATGAIQGAASSISLGAVGAPSSSDSAASRLGQAFGSVAVGVAGELTSDIGKGAMAVGLIAEAPSAGASSLAVAAGAGAVALGSAAEAGAAANMGRIATTPMESHRVGDFTSSEKMRWIKRTQTRMEDKISAPNAVRTYKKFKTGKTNPRPEISYSVIMTHCYRREGAVSLRKIESFAKIVILRSTRRSHRHRRRNKQSSSEDNNGFCPRRFGRGS
jgi:RHS repeat-associated protein